MNEKQTNMWIVDKAVEKISNDPQIHQAAEILRKNEVIAFPTETVYGLGGNARNDKAIDRIFRAKGRPQDNPLIVHISNESQLKEYVTNVPEKAEKLIEAFWPGPLTIVLPHTNKLSTKVTASLSTVGIRMPDHPVALALIEVAGIPLAAPSANTSGKPSPTTAEHVAKDLNGKIAGIIDGGETGVGLESTVVDCSNNEVMILRPGGITREQMEAVVGKVNVDPALIEENMAPRSPGMKYTHYAPVAPLVLIEGSRLFFEEKVKEAKQDGKTIGALVSHEWKGIPDVDVEVLAGSIEDLSTVAHQLYDSLRAFEDYKIDIIFSQVYPETTIGSAIMNRLRKAAGGTIISENVK
ncbi:threonylcarbamoyl-AMP synthase [Bacillus shivajii]|uniref:L-threonylcarbamoyladenylate synthase n=1 Tax=Bacillus shivajii TaxID=1983719 RepID=UPI001CF99259|nr:L-threonylcarbamoyladenylate synthase [Bacillus shivajii]UCZ53032.1 threonylcarbamoyl-AMP synthase [Bacillus shivajii]